MIYKQRAWAYLAMATASELCFPGTVSAVMPDISELRQELLSIERLIEDAFKRHSILSDQLNFLQGPSTSLDASTPKPARELASTWATVAPGKGKCASRNVSVLQSIPLSNSFAPLENLVDSTGPFGSLSQPERPTPSIGKAKKPRTSPSTPVSRGKRRRRTAPTGSTSGSDSVFASPVSRTGPSQPASRLSHSHASVNSGDVTGNRNTSNLSPQRATQSGSSSPPGDKGPLSQSAESSGDDVATSVSASNSSLLQACEMPTLSDCETPSLPLNLILCANGDLLAPEILILGDFTIRNVELPTAVTYCINGGKVEVFSGIVPLLLNQHPSVKFVIIHAGANDVMDRQSEKLHEDFENLCISILDLGKCCILSGPIPSLHTNNERFSRLFSLHQWLKNFCLAAGFNFISNFDYFWSRPALFEQDGYSPSRKGVQQLLSNMLQFIAFAL